MSRSLGRPGRVVVRALLITVGLTVLSGVLNLTIGVRAQWAWSIFGTGCTLALTLAVFTAAGAVISRNRLRALMVVAILAASVAGGIVLTLLWELAAADDYTAQDLAANWALALYLVSIAFVHTGLLSQVRTHTRLLLVIKTVTIVCAWLIVSVIVSLYWMEDVIGMNWQLLYLAAITAGVMLAAVAVGTLVVPVAAVSHANRGQAPVESIASRLSAHLECPRCGTRQTLGTGDVCCASCKGGLFIEVEEPRCECGYLLYRLEGDRCPECGRAVGVGDG